MSNEEKEKFKVVDKRRNREEAEEETSAESSSSAETPASETSEHFSTLNADLSSGEVYEPQEGEIPEDATVLDPTILGALSPALEVSKIALSMFITNCYVNLGLMPNPQTGEKKRDLEQVKLSIDCIEALFKIIGEKLSELERKELRSAIAQLQIQYVQEKKIL